MLYCTRKFSILWYNSFFLHAMLCIKSLAYAVERCLLVKFTNSVKTNNRILRLFSQSGSHAVLVFPYQTSWQYCDGDPLMGASNAGGVGKNRNSRISGYRSTTAAMRTTTMTIHHAVYRTYRHASVNLCLSQPAWTTTTKRREENRIYLYAVVNLKRK